MMGIRNSSITNRFKTASVSSLIAYLKNYYLKNNTPPNKGPAPTPNKKPKTEIEDTFDVWLPSDDEIPSLPPIPEEDESDSQ